MSERNATSDQRETGDRAAFLGRLRERASGVSVQGPHPPPPPPDVVPVLRWKALDGVGGDPASLRPVFVDAARRAGATVHEGSVETALAAIVAEHGVRSASCSIEVEAVEAKSVLENLGVEIVGNDPVAAEAADLGVTSAVAALATTGTVVVDADAAGGRSVSLLPPVHVCIVSVGRLLPTTAELLRGVDSLPSNRVLISGPSRTGDIEQILTVGIHGPRALHIVLLP